MTMQPRARVEMDNVNSLTSRDLVTKALRKLDQLLADVADVKSEQANLRRLILEAATDGPLMASTRDAPPTEAERKAEAIKRLEARYDPNADPEEIEAMYPQNKRAQAALNAIAGLPGITIPALVQIAKARGTPYPIKGNSLTKLRTRIARFEKTSWQSGASEDTAREVADITERLFAFLKGNDDE